MEVCRSVGRSSALCSCFRPSAFRGEMTIVEPTRSLGQDRNVCDESHLNFPDQNVGISGHAYQRMRTLGISSEMVAQTLNAPDRKSTRLNSSHLGISYAVFC